MSTHKKYAAIRFPLDAANVVDTVELDGTDDELTIRTRIEELSSTYDVHNFRVDYGYFFAPDGSDVEPPKEETVVEGGNPVPDSEVA